MVHLYEKNDIKMGIRKIGCDDVDLNIHSVAGGGIPSPHLLELLRFPFYSFSIFPYSRLVIPFHGNVLAITT